MVEIDKGNIRELWKISYPMMVSFFSLMAMMFVDRLYLSHYSIDALNACTQAGTLSWGLTLWWSTLGSMSEVFVAQMNGAKIYDKIGGVIWQVLWLVAISILFYIPIAFFASGWIYPPVTKNLEFSYFQTLMFFGPVISAVPALSGFFIGRGKTVIIQWLTILGNIINAVLDPIFIFGIKGIIPSLGMRGAAIATGLGNLIQVIILLIIFLKAKNNEKYNTYNTSIDRPLLRKILRIGLPPATFITLELMGWSLFYYMMALISDLHILVASLCQTIILLIMFFGLGLEKGIVAMTGNFIGQNNYKKIKTVLLSGIKLVCYFNLIALILIVFNSDFILSLFFSESTINSLEFIKPDKLKNLVRLNLFCATVYVLFENLRWVTSAILTAAGDTIFLMVSGIINVWLVLIVPTYFLVVLPKASITSALIIWIIYSIIAASVIYLRYLYGPWKQNKLFK